jgi:hypothetical protein
MKYTARSAPYNTYPRQFVLVREGNGIVFSSEDEVFIEHLAESLNHAVERLEKKNLVQKEVVDAPVSQEESDR